MTKEQEQKENDIGRTSRSLPLYLAERLYLEREVIPVNYVFCLKNVGPIVTGTRTSGKEYSAQFSEKPDFIITGTIEKDYLDFQTVIKIYLYSKKNDSEQLIMEKRSFNENISEIAASVADDALNIISKLTCTKEIPLGIKYPRPKKEQLPFYLDGLGQILMQTLVQNEIFPKEKIWGESDMLNWYQRLWISDSSNNCIILLYIKGIVASIDYQGEAYKNHLRIIKYHISNSKMEDDYFTLIAPLIYKKLNDTKNLKEALKKANKYNSLAYQSWLLKI
jgi:hypothetical protein